MNKPKHVVDVLLEAKRTFNKADLLDLVTPENHKRTKNLGWLLRNWQRVTELRFEYRPSGMADGELVAELRNGAGTWASEFASIAVCWNFLDRPIFRGLPFVLRRQDGSEERFTVGDARWRALNATSVQAYRAFLRNLGLRS